MPQKPSRFGNGDEVEQELASRRHHCDFCGRVRP